MRPLVPLCSRWFLALAATLGIFTVPRMGAPAPRLPRDATTLTVDGKEVRILRDRYGVPHVFATTSRGLYYGNGYAIAQDRMAQMDRYRRQARGELAEIAGRRALKSDQEARRDGYTEAEREAQLASLTLDLREAFQAYAEGVNAYLCEIEARGYPSEVVALGMKPRPWRPTDSLAIGEMMAHRFGGGGGGELRNLQVYRILKLVFGPSADAVLNDLAWRNDPSSPTTISAAESPRDPLAPPSVAPRRRSGTPRGPARKRRRQSGSRPRTSWGRVPLFQARLAEDLDANALARARAAVEAEETLAYARAHNLPTKLGSYAMAVSGRKMVGGAPVLVGGPQMGFGTPQIAHEVHLGGAGVDVIGMGFAGVPGVLIGHNRRLAWSTTTGVGDVRDVFVETLNPENPRQYRFNGQWREMERREEVIQVRDQEPVTVEVFRTVHGPVLEVDAANQRAYAQAASYWNCEYRVMEAIFRFNRARNLAEFAAAVPLVPTSHNWVCATQDGDIGYWFAGRFPIRAPGVDPRLPIPGTGRYEWRGFRACRACPQVVNPQCGAIGNWNNKPAVWWDHGDTPAWGCLFRVDTILAGLNTARPLTVAAVKALVRDIAIRDDRAAGLLPPLLRAVASAKLSPLARRAVAYLKSWDRLDSEGSVGKRIFDTYVSELRTAIFGDEFGFVPDQELLEVALSPSVLLRALQGKQAAVPMSRDYLNGKPAAVVMVAALEKSCARLAREAGPEVNHWRWPAHWIKGFRPLPPIPYGARGTYLQIVELCRPAVIGESILPPGQNEDPASPHYGDQRELAGYWLFKPMLMDEAALEGEG